jgi:hypothetical protein
LRKKGSPLGLGGQIGVGILIGLVAVFVLWQFIFPFFFGTTSKPSETVAQPQQAVISGSGIVPDGGATPAPKPAKPELEGAIVDARTGLPLAQAIIKKADGTELAKTDSEGRYWLTKKPAEKDAVQVVMPGYQALPLPLSAETAASVQLQMRVITGTLLDAETQKPIAQKIVWGGNKSVFTDAEGKFKFEGLADGAKIRVELLGYENADYAVKADETEVKLSVRSTSFSGQILDAKTGNPIFGGTIKTVDNSQFVFTDKDGKFTFNDLKRDANTELKVRAAGYKLQKVKASDLAKGMKLEPFNVRAVYVPGIYATRGYYDSEFTKYLKMGERGEINAIVVDVKYDDDGLLLYDSKVPLAKELNLVKGGGKQPNQLIDMPKMLKDARDRNIYVIARYVVMRDPAIAKAKPEWALRSIKTGQPWQDVNKLVWPNQFVPEVADYNASLARELAEMGVDEVQYDYIRFPTDGVLKDIQYTPELTWTKLNENQKLRETTINNIVKKAWDYLRTSDTFLSLDVFGMALWREDDNGIGQQYNDLVFLADYICPMVYATHFPQGTLDLKQHPGPVGAWPGVIIEKSGVIAGKLDNLLKPIARYRPWLEDFSLAPVKHTPERVRLQIEAAEKTGNYGWQLWNAAGNYNVSVLAAWAKNSNRP